MQLLEHHLILIDAVFDFGRHLCQHHFPSGAQVILNHMIKGRPQVICTLIFLSPLIFSSSVLVIL